jgi:hypothetical protein
LTPPAKSLFISITRQQLPSGFSAKDRTKLYIFMGRADKNPLCQHCKLNLIATSGTGQLSAGDIDKAV